MSSEVVFYDSFINLSSTKTARVIDQLKNPVFNSLTVTGTANITANALVSTHVVTSGSSYTCSATDYLVVVNKSSGSATTVVLPSSPAAGRTIMVKDGKGDASTNNITVNGGTIDNASSVVLNNNYAAVILIFSGSFWSIV